MSPSPEYEKLNPRMEQLALAVSEEFGIETEDFGSTIFRREDPERGFEPDSCLCVQNEERVRRKDRMDLDVDLPAGSRDRDRDHPPLAEQASPLRATRLPEVWRYESEKVAIVRLERTDYVEAVESPVLPPLTGAVPSGFMEKVEATRRTAWPKEVREWARGQA